MEDRRDMFDNTLCSSPSCFHVGVIFSVLRLHRERGRGQNKWCWIPFETVFISFVKCHDRPCSVWISLIPACQFIARTWPWKAKGSPLWYIAANTSSWPYVKWFYLNIKPAKSLFRKVWSHSCISYDGWNSLYLMSYWLLLHLLTWIHSHTALCFDLTVMHKDVVQLLYFMGSNKRFNASWYKNNWLSLA